MTIETPRTLEAVRGDITRETTDAIVNAANTGLARGGGVCGAIFAAAGPGLADACAALGGCPTGDARATPGFALPARFIVHAVGPVWHGGERGEPELLASAYRRALEVAGRGRRDLDRVPGHQHRDLRLPARAGDSHRRPHRGDTAVDGLELVRFVCFDGATLAAYERELCDGD